MTCTDEHLFGINYTLKRRRKEREYHRKKT